MLTEEVWRLKKCHNGVTQGNTCNWVPGVFSAMGEQIGKYVSIGGGAEHFDGIVLKGTICCIKQNNKIIPGT